MQIKTAQTWTLTSSFAAVEEVVVVELLHFGTEVGEDVVFAENQVDQTTVVEPSVAGLKTFGFGRISLDA